jgi:hypothetical protein
MASGPAVPHPDFDQPPLAGGMPRQARALAVGGPDLGRRQAELPLDQVK